MKINSGQAPSTLVPKYIGSDFDKVVAVADNIEQVVIVGDNIEDVGTVADNINYVKEVAEDLHGMPVTMYTGENPPVLSPMPEGVMWYCTTDGRTYVWYTDADSGQWVESAPQSATGVADSDVAQHEAKDGAHAISGVAGLQAALDEKYSPNNKPSAADVGAHPSTWVPNFSDVLSKPSTLTGYGITDALSTSGNEVLPLVNADVTSAYLTTSTTSANQVVDIASSTTYRTAKYLIQATSGTYYHACEATVIHDGTTASLVVYGDVMTGPRLMIIDADVSDGNVRLLATPSNATTTIKAVRISIDR